MTFEPRTTLVNGERAWQYIDWSPADLAEREVDGRVGRPLRHFLVFRDRVEIVISWSFSSGHAEWYVEGDRRLFQRADVTELARPYGETIVAEIQRAFAALDPTSC